MKRLLVFLLLALFLAVPAGAQIVEDPTTGGGATTIISGTTPITGGATTQVCYNQGGFLKCGDAGLIYAESTDILTMLGGATVGSTTTAGTGTTTILASISGSSATSNFLNITGTFPASIAADTSSLYLSTSSGGDAGNFDDFGIFSTIAGTTGASGKNVVSIFGSSAATAGSGWSVGVAGEVISNTASKKFVGVYGASSPSNSSSGFVLGVLGAGLANGGTPTTSIGVWGESAAAGTNKIGGYFKLSSTALSTRLGAIGLMATPPTGTAALVADNGSVAENIFEARDNGTAVFTIADGGYIQGTQGEVALNANYTNATATFSSTALSVAVVSGRTYSFDLGITFDDSTAADGAQFDFNGGSAAATNFRVHCISTNAAGATLVQSNAASTALATANAVTLALTTQADLSCHGSFVPSGSGTFIFRAAQSAHTTGTLTIHRGSWLSVRDARPL